MCQTKIWGHCMNKRLHNTYLICALILSHIGTWTSMSCLSLFCDATQVDTSLFARLMLIIFLLYDCLVVSYTYKIYSANTNTYRQIRKQFGATDPGALVEFWVNHSDKDTKLTTSNFAFITPILVIGTILSIRNCYIAPTWNSFLSLKNLCDYGFLTSFIFSAITIIKIKYIKSVGYFAVFIQLLSIAYYFLKISS